MSKLKLNSLINYLNDLFPQSNASKWDKVGFQIEEVYNLPSQDEVNSIIVCLDVTKEVVDMAIKTNSNFIVSRHPFFFTEVENELQNPAKKEIFDNLIKYEIQIFSIHTNYDNNDSSNLINLINTQLNIKKYEKIGEHNEGYEIHFLREITLKEFIEKIKSIFGQNYNLISTKADLEILIDKFYITPGSGAETMIFLKLQNTVFLTGEAKWHEWLYADQNNVNLLTVGHYMENHFINDIKINLNKTFPTLKVYDFDIKNLFKYI